MEIPNPKYRLLRLMDLDAHFRASPDAVLLNKVDFTRAGYADELNSKLYSGNSEMDFVGSCECGYYQDNYYIDATCPKCRTVVRSPLTFGRDHLPHTTWISVPEAIPGVLHPVFYRVLSKWLKYDRTKNYIDAILNPLDPIPAALENIITGRGFAYFYENFDVLMEIFLSDPKRPNRRNIRQFIRAYRSLAFIRHMPALSNVLHPVTSADDTTDSSRQYTDKDSQFFLQAAHALSFIEMNPKKVRRAGQLDIKVFAAYKNYIEYQNRIADRRLSHKPSLLRRHIFGSRFHWSFRGVITPIPGPHHYDELHIPWVIGVNTFRVHIVGQLVRKYRMPITAAMSLHKHAESQFDPTINEIMCSLINDAPYDGIPCIFGRNPSIQRGAAQLFYITKIKTAIEDKAIGISVLVLARPNADQRIVATYAA